MKSTAVFIGLIFVALLATNNIQARDFPVLEGPYLSLEIGVNESLVQERGWAPSGNPLGRISATVMNSLVQACTLISNESLRPGSESELDQSPPYQ